MLHNFIYLPLDPTGAAVYQLSLAAGCGGWRPPTFCASTLLRDLRGSIQRCSLCWGQLAWSRWLYHLHALRGRTQETSTSFATSLLFLVLLGPARKEWPTDCPWSFSACSSLRQRQLFWLPPASPFLSAAEAPALCHRPACLSEGLFSPGCPYQTSCISDSIADAASLYSSLSDLLALAAWFALQSSVFLHRWDLHTQPWEDHIDQDACSQQELASCPSLRSSILYMSLHSHSHLGNVFWDLLPHAKKYRWEMPTSYLRVQLLFHVKKLPWTAPSLHSWRTRHQSSPWRAHASS